MKIRDRLIMGFSIIIFLVIITGILTFIQTTQIAHEFDVVEQKTTPAMLALSDIKANLFFLLLEVNEYVLDPISEHLEEFEEAKEGLMQAVLSYELAEEGQEEEEEIEEFKEEIMRVFSISDELINMKNARVSQEVLIVKIRELDEISEEFSHELDNEIQHDLEELSESHQAVDDQIQATNNLTIIIITIIVILSIIIAWVFSISILKPISKLQDASNKIAQGNLDVNVDIKGNDEISNLSNSFNKMKNSIQNTIDLEKNLEKAEIIIQLEQAKKLDKLKDEFSSMITHELKTPLTPIRGYCEILKDENFGTLTKDQISYVEKIDSSAVLLERLISDVLDVQKLDMGKMTFNKESFDVCNFLDELKQDFSHLMKDKGIEFVVTDSVNVTLKTDQLRLLQVLENLIINSVDFVPSKDGKIEVGIKQENGKMIFHVKDNGVGILKDKQQNIFKKFYQVDTSYTRKHGGTGLGLVVCKGIVNALGGEIWFESELGKGTTFYFSIPIYEEKITMEPPR